MSYSKRDNAAKLMGNGNEKDIWEWNRNTNHHHQKDKCIHKREKARTKKLQKHVRRHAEHPQDTNTVCGKKGEVLGVC